jgi:delta-1-pyrroline-5-carboxylate synthetase
VKTGELLGLPPCPAPKHEYGNLACTVELVGGMQQAIDHIHEFGSSHTECIVTEDAARASEFLQRVVRATRVRESRRLE